MTAINSFATFSLCKNKDLLQLDLAYVHPALSDWIKLKKQISGFQSNSTSSLVFKTRTPFSPTPPKVLDLWERLKRHFLKNWKNPNQIIVVSRSEQHTDPSISLLRSGNWEEKFRDLLCISQATDSNWIVSSCSICFLSSKLFWVVGVVQGLSDLCDSPCFQSVTTEIVHLSFFQF